MADPRWHPEPRVLTIPSGPSHLMCNRVHPRPHRLLRSDHRAHRPRRVVPTDPVRLRSTARPRLPPLGALGSMRTSRGPRPPKLVVRVFGWLCCVQAS